MMSFVITTEDLHLCLLNDWETTFTYILECLLIFAHAVRKLTIQKSILIYVQAVY